MSSDAPEFYTKPSTPLSPLPFHPPEPSNITVLRNQIDPVFNMTSTHLQSVEITDGTSEAPLVQEDHATIDVADAPMDTLDDSSFSDAYNEEEAPGNIPSNGILPSTDADDDYAKEFESEVEGEQNALEANAEAEKESSSTTLPVGEHLMSTVPEPPATEVSNDSNSSFTPNPASEPLPPTTSTENTPIAADSTAASKPAENVPSQAQAQSYEDIANGEIDIQQLLDNITATAELKASNSTTTTPVAASPVFTSFPPPSSGLPAHASLPPRPPGIPNPPLHQGYASQDSIRKYHAAPPSIPTPPISSYGPPGVPGSIVAAGAPGTSTDARHGLPPPPSASFHPPSAMVTTPSISSSQYQQVPPPSTQDRPTASIEPIDGDHGEVLWGPAIQKLYDDFLADERAFVAEGLWDRFPTGSRLFIGNLPTEKVTKRDLFHAFHKYGRLAQVSIKQAYGFVQFHDVSACYNALEREQGQEIRGRKMHLEISKPQKNSRQAVAAASAAPVGFRRSRSPDYARASVIDRGVARGGQTAPSRGGYDRYDARPPTSSRDNEYRSTQRARDDYRPPRSPTPPRGSYRGRDDYGRDYDYGRDRRRSRSRSPYGRRDSGRYRNRSPSPHRRGVDEEADLQIPRRDARDVPDVQIILMDDLDRGFVTWVDDELRARNIKTEIMFLSPRLPLSAVIRRQIVEGVLAVAQLTRRSQDTSKIPLQVFDRKGGADNVRFDEYQDLEPKIAAELVLRAKQAQIPVIPAYAQPQYAVGQSYQPPAPAPAPAAASNLANLVGNLDNASLQKLLGTLNATSQQQQSVAQPNTTIDLAGILGGFTGQAQQQHSYQPQPQASNNYASPAAGAPDLASLLGTAGQAQPQQSAQQVQNIMAQLARFRQ
ncbi:MAG: hypothetical protein M1818_000661 [Claussenomyces sp. TS43310]|nr:MAG: hypothetical protein M1818_000661 [Claussenomyces sp. TS43310]